MEKPSWLKDIKVLVWDLDGTLYQEKPALKKEIYQHVLSLISQKKNINLQQAGKLYDQLHQKLKSSTLVLADCGIEKKIILEGEWFSLPQLKYLDEDPRISRLFSKLSKFKHIMLTNSNFNSMKLKLKKLALDQNCFEKIFTVGNDYKMIKPNLLAFKAVVQYTKMKPYQHLFIGDSEDKEMIPAKKLGMHTCFVWGESKLADISLPRVWDIVKLWQ